MMLGILTKKTSPFPIWGGVLFWLVGCHGVTSVSDKDTTPVVDLEKLPPLVTSEVTQVVPKSLKCSLGDTKCAGPNQQRRCLARGVWGEARDCPFLCIDGSCQGDYLTGYSEKIHPGVSVTKVGCFPQDKVLGGECQVSSTASSVGISSGLRANQWMCRWDVEAPANATVMVYVVCQFSSLNSK